MKRGILLKHFEKSVKLVELFICIFLLLSCSFPTLSKGGYIYKIPEQTGDGWQTASAWRSG